MRVEFDKIGQGCDICVNKPACCPKCERNPALLQLRDFFKRPPKEAPKPPLRDDTASVIDANRGELADWGIHVPRKDHFQPPAAGQQEPAGADGKQE